MSSLMSTVFKLKGKSGILGKRHLWRQDDSTWPLPTTKTKYTSTFQLNLIIHSWLEYDSHVTGSIRNDPYEETKPQINKDNEWQ